MKSLLDNRTFPDHVDAMSPYMANLCPLFDWVEFAGFREDFRESISE